MPTVTEISQYAVTNVGPLTTVFTTPAACATANPEFRLALSDVVVGDQDTYHAVYWRKNCGPVRHGECFPSGAEVDRAIASAESKGYSEVATIRYFSPGGACPDSWTTAGVASKAANGSVSSSGGFVPPVMTAFGGTYMMGYNPPANVMMEILEPEEDAVMCCPQGYLPGFAGDCFSSVPDSVYGDKKTICHNRLNPEDMTQVTRMITYNDTIVTAGVWSVTVSSRSFLRTSGTIDDGWAASAYAVTMVPGVTLVNGPARETGASATGSSGTGAESGTGTPTQTPSASHRVRASGGGVGLMAAVWGLAALAGVAIALPL